MSRFFILVLFIIVGLAAKSQNLKGVKSIIQYEDTAIRHITIYDKNGNVIFWKERQLGPIVMLGINYYDSLNRNIKSIIGHSNTDISVWLYEFDSLGNKIKTIEYDNLVENNKEHKFNPLIYIDNYNNFKDVENDPVVLEMIAVNKKHILFEKKYNQNKELLQEILF